MNPIHPAGLLTGIVLLLALSPLCSAGSDDLRRAASKGDADAAFKLGLEYYAGTADRTKNPEVAVYWFRKAAEKGNIPAYYNLGVCLEHGLGAEKSRIEAYHAYRKAADKGLVQAQLRCAEILKEGLPDPSRDPCGSGTGIISFPETGTAENPCGTAASCRNAPCPPCRLADCG